MVGIGHYKGGEFWPAVWGILNLIQKHSRQTDWGNLFLEVIKKYKLPKFEDEKALKYITPILGHGGIPNYCLPDFFEKLLLPIINGEIDATSTDIGEILQEWKRCPSLFAAADKPIYRFLLYGGKIASDFLARCIQVAQDIIDGNDLDETYEHSQIPVRVIEQFEDWHKNNKGRIKKSTTFQLKSPKIIFDELENKITCLIPEQILLDDCQSPVYELYADNDLIASQKVRSYKYTNKTMIDETEFILPPAKNYSIRLIVSKPRKWEFFGLRDGSLWIAFSDDRDRLLMKRELLPRSSFWLVHNHSLKIKENDCIIEEPVFLADKWKDYKYIRINAESTTSLTLLGTEDYALHLPLSSSKEPYLNRQPLHGIDIDSYPLFSERLPSVCIPFDNPEELNQWTIRIRPLKQNQKIKLYLLHEVCQFISNKEATIDLSDGRLIGECPFGIFIIRLRGKLGNDKDFTFGFIKQFEFADEDKEFFLAEEAPTILIETIPDIVLTSTDYCQVLNKDEISVAKGTAKASLEVLYKDNNFVLSFDIPRLMWKVQGLDNVDYLGWQSKEIEIPIDELQTGQDVLLIIRANLKDGEKCSLQIENIAYKEEKAYRAGRVKFDLRSITDTISLAGLPLVLVSLNFDNPKYIRANRLVLKVRTKWTIERNSFSYGTYMTDIRINEQTLWITWDERRPVKNRIMRLWDCTRPWKQPKEYNIEDGKTELVIENTLNALPSGCYRAEFTTANKWVVEEEQKFCPKEIDFNVFPINLSGDYIGLTEDFELGLFNVLSTQDTYNLKTPDSFEEAKQLCRVLLFLYHEGKLDFCSNFWREVSTGTCKSFLKDELCNLGNLIESLIPFKKGEIVRWIIRRKNVRFEGIIDGFLKLSNDDNSKHSIRLSVLKELEVAPPNSKIGPWRKKRS